MTEKFREIRAPGTFTPLSTGMKSGTVNIFSHATNGSQVGVSLKGTGY